MKRKEQLLVIADAERERENFDRYNKNNYSLTRSKFIIVYMQLLAGMRLSTTPFCPSTNESFNITR